MKTKQIERLNPLINADNIAGTAANACQAIQAINALLVDSKEVLNDREKTGVWLLMKTIEAALQYHEGQRPN